MKLILDPMDLKREYQKGEGGEVDQAISTRDVTFGTLNDQAQRAVTVVGRATFYAWDHQTYNAIYPPNNGAGGTYKEATSDE